jgi:hypothetical protein
LEGRAPRKETENLINHLGLVYMQDYYFLTAPDAASGSFQDKERKVKELKFTK